MSEFLPILPTNCRGLCTANLPVKNVIFCLLFSSALSILARRYIKPHTVQRAAGAVCVSGRQQHLLSDPFFAFFGSHALPNAFPKSGSGSGRRSSKNASVSSGKCKKKKAFVIVVAAAVVVIAAAAAAFAAAAAVARYI